ncbi:PREDICTED: MICOS complex subunit MIC27-like [Eufriesea mexicana]|uniref:MICOS complex subunit MIC27-like n=1 Tax=Eufriesea mexicana TaxID=516756 RepID=UPI00083C3357|nr:PREDICTED: MICOS complex subunit MIC27-like [Eufriesea mexicana]
MKLFKKFLMPCGLCAAVPAMKPTTSSEEHTTPCNNETQGKKLIKPSELPIYSIDDGYSKQMPCVEYPSIVEENIRKVRQTVQKLKLISDTVSHNVSNAFENFKFVVDYLQDNDNYIPRLGAVGIGGLSGLVLSLRGGKLKRLVYTSTGASIIGCICFPKEMKQVVDKMEHYMSIGYNFIYDVKPGDSQKEISLNEFPILKSVIELEYFRMITEFFKQKTNDTTDVSTETTVKME